MPLFRIEDVFIPEKPRHGPGRKLLRGERMTERSLYIVDTGYMHTKGVAKWMRKACFRVEEMVDDFVFLRTLINVWR